MTKTEARQKYKGLRNTISAAQVETMSLAIANLVVNMSIWDKTYFHLFLPIAEFKEVDTEFILQILSGRDKEIVVSKSNFKTNELLHYLLTDNTQFKKNQYNIPEPVDGIEVPVAKIDVVFVPLLAYDKKGNRVGYGKGFYDRFLSNCRKDVVKIGLSFFEPEETLDDVDRNDIRLDYCVTPFGINSFG